MFYGFNPCLAESKFLGSQERMSHPLPQRDPLLQHYKFHQLLFSSPPPRPYSALRTQNSGHEYELPLPSEKEAQRRLSSRERAREAVMMTRALDESRNQDLENECHCGMPVPVN